MTNICIGLDGTPSLEKVVLGNQWENNDDKINFILPEEFKTFHKYVIAVYRDKTTTKVLPIVNDSFVISTNITYLSGTWYMYVMCREIAIDLDSGSTDLSARQDERVFISNAFIGVVNSTYISQENINNMPMDANLKIVYDDMFGLKKQLQHLIDVGGVVGEDGFSPTVELTPLENGTKVSITDKDGIKEFDILNGVNGKDGANGIDGVTPNLTIGNVTTLSSDQEATATITGTKENPVLNLGLPKGKDGQTATSDGTSSITKDTYGEKLIAEYIHRGNQEIHFIEFDWETGIGTTSEPHGLTGSHRIIIVPNDWYTRGHKNIAYVPNEWLIYSSYIHVTYVNDNQLMVTGSDAATAIAVNPNDSRQNIDITKFHFEIPIDWTITNLNINRCKRLKVIMHGYLRSITYRYMNLSGKFEDAPDDKIEHFLWTSEYLGIPRIIRVAPHTIHGLFAMIEHTFDMSLPLHCYFRQNTTVWGKRSWDDSLTNFSHDQNTETQIMYYNILKPVRTIDIIDCSKSYGMISNYSVIRIYALSEEPDNG